MKVIKTILAISLVTFLFTSCAHSVYPTISLYNSYNSKMKSDEELEIKGKVNIYFSEKDIDGEYEIISLNTYKPTSLFPFPKVIMKKMTKKFLKEAVLKAYEEGGNAILVQSAGFFYVLNLKNWVADDAPAASFLNPIFDMKLSEEIKSGALSTLKRNARVRKEKAFIEELNSNVENMVNLEEIAAVRKKIAVLSDYNHTLKHPQSAYEKKVKKFSKKCDRLEKKINKEAAKKAKAAKGK